MISTYHIALKRKQLSPSHQGPHPSGRTVSYHSLDTAPNVVEHNGRTSTFIEHQSLKKSNNVVDHIQTLKNKLLIGQNLLASSAL